jgi:hypothetical protein
MGNSLEQQMQSKEKIIKQKLETTGVIDSVKFHHQNYFSIEFKVYNNTAVRAIIDECCKGITYDIKQKVKHIKNIEEQNTNGEYKRRVEIDPTIKEKAHIIHQILEILDKSLDAYLLKNEHQKAIVYYNKLRKRRQGIF